MLKVLIAEDDLMLADLAEEILVEGGYQVCGIARTVSEAVTLAQHHKPDLAVLDFRLADGGLGTEIAAQLLPFSRLGVLYATGNASQVVLTTADGDACLSKPYSSTDLLRGVEIVAEMVATGKALPPFPRGFQILPPRSDGTPGSHHMNSDGAKVQKLLRQQAALARFGSFALREDDLPALLTEAARVCAESLGVPFAKVCRYRPAENDLVIEAGHGWKAGVIGTIVSADRSSPQGHAFVTREPSICNDIRKDSNFELPAFYAAHSIVSTVDVVIHVKDDEQPYGVLEIDNDHQHDYDQHDIDFLTGFANVLAEAVATSARMATLMDTVARMKVLVKDKDRLLDQKKVLAEELQHRVRNNLQLVYGMLSKQLSDTADLAGQRGIKAIARRVSTLAQVYDHLLGAEMTRTIDFGGYVKSLCLNLADIQGASAANVTLTCDSEPVMLDLDVATALGIVVAEAVTNSYDHGFAGRVGSIIVSVRSALPDVNRMTLTISDDGEGFTPQTESKRHGLGLMRRLVQQIGGTARLDSKTGTVWTIVVPVSIFVVPVAIEPDRVGVGRAGA